MSQPAIRVENLSKQFRIGARQQGYRTFREALTDAAAAPLRRLRRLARPGLPSSVSRPEDDTIWALKDVSFEVQPGEVVGIIGRNGAGKSTLLKVLSRITEPTHGRVEIRGRVASLLEVGTGFHPELTGRENILLNGAVLGMSRREILAKFDEIVAFAEVERFIDTPVKRYSSGMYLRLAFAVAAHLDPEILMVDEVLAVGDAAFQKKCLGKMGEVARGGRTVLFVSHNMTAISHLCECALWLRDGLLFRTGTSERVVSAYLAEGLSSGAVADWPSRDTSPGDHRVRIRRVRLADREGHPASSFFTDDAIQIEIDYDVLEPVSVLRMGFMLMTATGSDVLTTGDTSRPDWPDVPVSPGHYRSRCTIPPNLLTEHHYVLTVFANLPKITNIAVLDRVLQFEVVRAETIATRHNWGWAGVVCPELRWQVLAG